MSISSTTCTSPIEPTRTPASHEAPATVPAPHPTDLHSLGSVVSRQTSPCPGRSPKRIDIHVRVPGAISFELDDILSPLSQFELDPLEAELSKLPLSDTVNRPYPGQHTTSPGVTVDTTLRRDGSSGIQSLSMNWNHEPLDVSLDIVGGSNSDTRTKKGREFATGNPGVKRMKKRAVIWSGSPPSDTKERIGAEDTSNHSEPPSKKFKTSHYSNDSEGRGTKSLPRRGGIAKVKRPSRSPSRPAAEDNDLESARPRDKKIPKPTGHAQLQQPTPGSPAALNPMDAVDVEFHVSLTGMLIEAFATSRATSMDSAALYLVLTQVHPYLATERSREELLVDIAAVLEAGRARCGMFEKVDSSGERSRHKVLESRWFYVPERDEDRERASLIRAIMPRQKRNETKKYKQYYYRPLDKISKWDPEDAL